MYVAQQTGKIVTAVTNGHITAPLRALQRLSTGGEEGLLGIVFSNDGKKLYADITDPKGDIRIIEYTMTGATSPTCVAPPAAHDPASHVPEPQRRRSRDRRRQHAVHRRSATAVAPATRCTTGRTRTRCSPRSCASNPNRKRQRAVHDSARQPVRGPGGQARRDLDVRAAQPVALLVRPREPRPLDRRRGSGPLRGDRLRQGRREGLQLGLERAGGIPPLQRRRRCRPVRTTRSSNAPTTTATARSRVVTCTARRRSRTSTAPTCSATRAPASCARSRRRTARSPQSRDLNLNVGQRLHVR